MSELPEGDDDLKGDLEQSVPSDEGLKEDLEQPVPSDECLKDLEQPVPSDEGLKEDLEQPVPSDEDLKDLEQPVPSDEDLKEDLEQPVPSDECLKDLEQPVPSDEDLKEDLEQCVPSSGNLKGDLEQSVPSYDDLKGDLEQSVPSDDEDDYEGYFLEPVANSVDIAEKIAEANRKLLEEAEEGDREDESRPRKVQFSEELVNFEPNYYSDDDCTQSAQNSVISEEDVDIKPPQDELKIEDETILEEEVEEAIRDDDIPEEIPEEADPTPLQDIIDESPERNAKFILILLPKEQNSSCESIIGEEILEEVKNDIEENTIVEPEKPAKTKMARPKSAKKSCDVSKISPNLSCSSCMERKSWQTSRNPLLKPKAKREEGREKKNVFVGEMKVQIKGRFLKKININDLSLGDVPPGQTLKRCSERPRSCHAGRNTTGDANRPKTAPMQRTCCVIKTELPHYNGLRSEYGLSAEQLQERKQKSLENRMKQKEEKIKKRQEEVKKRNENEETFQKWLFSKTKKSFRKKSLKLRDTLARSDVYIQTHASYAANRSVPYCLDYSISKKLNNRKREPRVKKSTIAVEKLLDNMTPNFKRSFNIYLGMKP